MTTHASTLIASQTQVQAIIDRGVVVHLYTNAADPDDDRFALKEPDDPGYEPFFAAEGWTMDETGQATHRGLHFRFSQAGAKIHGWFLTDTEGNFLGACACPDGPFLVRVAGEKIWVKPTIAGK